jgi:hypothetical protein
MSDTRLNPTPGWGPGNPEFDAQFPGMTEKSQCRDKSLRSNGKNFARYSHGAASAGQGAARRFGREGIRKRMDARDEREALDNYEE